MESARGALDMLGIGPEVAVITRDQVSHAKPDPDLFIAAADRLAMDIGNSVVVGDSVWDMLAARRARALGVGLLCWLSPRTIEQPRGCVPKLTIFTDP